jgi:hypothetical protein
VGRRSSRFLIDTVQAVAGSLNFGRGVQNALDVQAASQNAASPADQVDDQDDQSNYQ